MMILLIVDFLILAALIYLVIRANKTPNKDKYNFTFFCINCAIVFELLILLTGKLFFVNLKGERILLAYIYATVFLLLYLIMEVIAFVIYLAKKKKQEVKINELHMMKVYILILCTFLLTPGLMFLQTKIFELQQQSHMNRISQKMMAANAVIRYSFTGMENMFHEDYEYYYLESDNTYKECSQSTFLEYFGEGTEEYTQFNNREDLYCYVTVEVSSKEEESDDDREVISMPGITNCNVLIRSINSNTTCEITDQERGLILALNHEMEPQLQNKIMQSTEGSIVLNYYLITDRNHQYYYVIWNEIIYFVDNNNLIKVMDVPENGGFDYMFFT